MIDPTAPELLTHMLEAELRFANEAFLLRCAIEGHAAWASVRAIMADMNAAEVSELA